METTSTCQDYQYQCSVGANQPNKATLLFRRPVLLRCIACSLFLLITYTGLAQVRSAANGNWSDGSTWAGGIPPKSTDNVIIELGHRVTINGQANSASIELLSPPNNSFLTNTELLVTNGASLTTQAMTLTAKNDRRNSILINEGGTIALNALTIGKGSILENTKGTVSVSGNITNNGDIITASALLKIGGNYSGTGFFTKGNGTVIYAGTAAAGQTIAPLNYHNLQLSGNNTKSTTTDFSVTSNLLVEPGTTFAAANYNYTITGDLINQGTLTTQAANITIGGNLSNTGTLSAGAANYSIKGNFNNNGNFQAGTSTIALQGTTLQQIAGNTTFYNLTYNGSGESEILNDITVLNNFTINNGHLTTGGNTLTLGQAATIAVPETDTSHIIGNVRTTRTLFPGVKESFGNIGITLSRNETDPGLIVVERLTGISTHISEGAYSIDRQYNVSRVDTTTDISDLSMNMEFNFLPKELKSKPLNEYKLYRKAKNQEVTVLPSTVVDQTTLKYSGANKFGTYTLAAGPMPLPVELVRFQVFSKDHQVILKWQTASEQNNKGFEIQASTDGKNFTPIWFVESKNSYSSTLQDYTYTDSNPKQNQTLYYRLKQIDHSGKSEYSAVKMVRVAAVATLQAFPNPFSDHLLLYLPVTHANLKITDVSGKVVINYNLTPAHRNEAGYFVLQTTHITKQGMYIIQVLANGHIYTSKLLKQ